MKGSEVSRWLVQRLATTGYFSTQINSHHESKAVSAFTLHYSREEVEKMISQYKVLADLQMDLSIRVRMDKLINQLRELVKNPSTRWIKQ